MHGCFSWSHLPKVDLSQIKGKLLNEFDLVFDNSDLNL